jgi:hypothetical protein
MQHSTCNTQHSTECKYDLEDRLLDYAARIIRLTSALAEELIRIFAASIRTSRERKGTK